MRLCRVYRPGRYCRNDFFRSSERALQVAESGRVLRLRGRGTRKESHQALLRLLASIVEPAQNLMGCRWGHEVVSFGASGSPVPVAGRPRVVLAGTADRVMAPVRSLQRGCHALTDRRRFEDAVGSGMLTLPGMLVERQDWR